MTTSNLPTRADFLKWLVMAPLVPFVARPDLIRASVPSVNPSGAIFEQIHAGGKAVDYHGNKLHLSDLDQHLYYVRRNREAYGDRTDVVDAVASPQTRGAMRRATFDASRLAPTTRPIGMKLAQACRHGDYDFFTYDLFDRPDAGVQMAAITFSGVDHLTGCLMMIDWSDVRVDPELMTPVVIDRPTRHLVLYGFSDIAP